MRTAGRIVAIVLLLGTGGIGILNGIRERGDGLTVLQQSVTVAVLFYGVLGLLGGVGLIRRQSWTVPVTIGWTVASMYAGSVASFAFHDPGLKQPGTLTGVASAFVSIALVGAFVVWVARRESKPDTVEVSRA